MLSDYADIKALTDQEPTWYDDNGVPRYCAFSPDSLGVYIKYACYVEIACQSCAKRFMVGVGANAHSWFPGDEEPHFNTLESLTTRFHYGDPPRHDCVGDTMNCVDIKIVEAWQKGAGFDWYWKRISEYEQDLITDPSDWRAEYVK